MSRTLWSTILFGALVVGPCFAMSKNEQAEVEKSIRALDKDEIHKLVNAVEAEPIGERADKIRPILAVYFEPIHYDVCLDQIGFLLHTERKVLMNVFWQVVHSSGDFFLQHPAESSDRLVYMQAGLESGLRVYERILAVQPDARHAKLDELVALRDSGRLGDFVRANPCPKK